jgi:predicted RNase H-like HicB family nuclease
MSAQAVRMRVVAPVGFECSFWIEDDGWKVECEELSLLTSGKSFEDAKAAISSLLRLQVETIIREHKKEQSASTTAKVLQFHAQKNIRR